MIFWKQNVNEESKMDINIFFVSILEIKIKISILYVVRFTSLIFFMARRKRRKVVSSPWKVWLILIFLWVFYFFIRYSAPDSPLIYITYLTDFFFGSTSNSFFGSTSHSFFRSTSDSLGTTSVSFWIISNYSHFLQDYRGLLYGIFTFMTKRNSGIIIQITLRLQNVQTMV